MKDTIYREDAIEAIQTAYCKPCKERGDDHNEVVCRACDFDDAMCQIDALPSAEAVQGWIPCSERLPSEDGCYLVCMAWEYENVEVLKWADGWNCYRDYDGKVDREHEIDGADIIAWMPLPEPYKGGGSE